MNPKVVDNQSRRLELELKLKSIRLRRQRNKGWLVNNLIKKIFELKKTRGKRGSKIRLRRESTS